MRKYLELFKDGFDATIADKTEVKNWPYVGYSPSEGVVFTVIPAPVEGPADNEIWYTSSNGDVVTPYKTDVFGANIISNTYDNGKGVITFDGPVTSIGEWAFSRCSSLTSIIIPNSVTSIGNNAFYGCTSLTSIVIPDSVTSIGWRAFERCSSLTSIVIPNSVTTIGDREFYKCSGLTSITIPNSVTSIGKYAFEDCSGLTSVTIPNSVDCIDPRAFYNCYKLTSITYEGTTEQWNAIEKLEDWNYRVPATYVQCTDGQVVL